MVGLAENKATQPSLAGAWAELRNKQIANILSWIGEHSKIYFAQVILLNDYDFHLPLKISLKLYVILLPPLRCFQWNLSISEYQ